MSFKITKHQWACRAAFLIGLSFVGFEVGCSGTPDANSPINTGGVAGSVSTGGASTSGGTHSTATTGVCAFRPSNCYALCEGGLCDCYCPGTGGAGSGTGGATAAGGAIASGGSSSRGVCNSGCTLESTSSAFCDSSQYALVCKGPFPSDLSQVMTRNGCRDAATGAVRYCCPPAIMTQCQ